MALTEEQLRCRDIILSQEYADFIVEYGGNIDVMVNTYNPSCYEVTTAVMWSFINHFLRMDN